MKRKYDALLLDAGGTLLQLAHPVHDIYSSIGLKYGQLFLSFSWFLKCSPFFRMRYYAKEDI